MLIALLCAVLAAPLYWAFVPVRWRREVLTLASLLALGIYDARLLAALMALNLVLFGLLRAMAAGPPGRARALAACGVLLLVALFAWNKLAAGGGGVLPSQGGLVFLGLSYLVLKAAAALLDTLRGAHRELRFRDLLAWMVFLPTYPSGPIEELAHFRDQTLRVSQARVLTGLERILFGLVKALVLSHQLGQWAGPILSAPDAHGPLKLLAGTYAFTLRFYLDFAGYSDIAIGLAALFGYEIRENFDNPLVRRNLVQLWQRWHMTLTAWLRRYLFVPLARAIMRRGEPRWDPGGPDPRPARNHALLRPLARAGLELRRLGSPPGAGIGLGGGRRARPGAAPARVAAALVARPPAGPRAERPAHLQLLRAVQRTGDLRSRAGPALAGAAAGIVRLGLARFSETLVDEDVPLAGCIEREKRQRQRVGQRPQHHGANPRPHGGSPRQAARRSRSARAWGD